MRGLRSLSLAAGSGVLLALSFPSANLAPLAWCALVPLLHALRGRTVREGALLGWTTGLVFFIGTVSWVTNSVHHYGGVPLVPALLITLLLCAFLALFFAGFSAAAVRVRTAAMPFVFIVPAVWVACELLRTHLFTGFPWALLGYSQYRYLAIIQVADLTGVYGLSFVVVLVNAAIAELVADRTRFRPLAAAALTLALVLAYGGYRLLQPDAEPSFTAAVVQGNIEQDRKWDPAYQQEVIGTYRRLTRIAVERMPDLVIWPETATPFYFGGSGGNEVLSGELLSFVRSLRTPLLTGSPTYEVRPGRVLRLKNSAFLLSGGGSIASAYHKMHLVPFGEYVPLKAVLFFVEKMVQAVGDFEAGGEHTVARTDGARIGTVICYEIIFPDLVRRFVKNGATVIATITNDAWFGRSAAPHQHFSMAVLRAVENRVPVARAANTGISGFIDAKGRVLDASDIFTEAVLVRKIAPGTGELTPYTRFGDVFAYLCTGVAVLALAIARKQPT